MKIETGKDIYGREFKYMRSGLVRGRNELMREGFTQGANPLYYSKDGIYWHFNKLMGVWLEERPIITEDRAIVA